MKFPTVVPRLVALLVFAVAAALQPGHAATDGALPDVKIGADAETFTLDNGLQVVVVPDRRAPVVTHMIWYKAGSADEPRGKSGIAHFLEHLMFKGTKKHPEGEFSRVIASVGGQENAFTSYDYTAYYQRVAKQHLKTMMEYEADRMTNLVLTEQVVLPEREVILEERAQRTDNDPSAQLGETLSAVLYPYSPYGVPVIGWENEMRTLGLEDAIAFYERFYTPNNAILIVAGDIETDEVKALVADTWAKVPRRFEPEPRIRQDKPQLYGSRIVRYESPLVRQASVRRSWVVPSSQTDSGTEAEALDVLSQVLGGGATSRIYKSLVVRQQIATYAGGWYGGSSLGDSQFVVYGAPVDGKTNEEVLAALKAEIEKLAEEGVSEEELRLAKKSLVAEAFFAQDSQSTLARIFGSELAIGTSIAEIQNWPARIAAVTADQVVAVAKKYLLSEQTVTGYLEPAATDEKS